jgi:hypothetical protein
MKVEAESVREYLAKIPSDRKAAFNSLRQTILANLPEGFEERMSYGMIGYVVPHSIYPAGYHCDSALPLPFASIAAQKNFIAFYHSGLYADPKLLDWFVKEYPKHSAAKLDMGKSCVRFRKFDDIPQDLIGALMKKMSARQWIRLYESRIKR